MHRCVILASAVVLAGCGGSTVKQPQATTAPPSHAARFTIVGGKIVAWEQIPVPPTQAAPVA
jgi:hypothetical protein